MKKIELTKGKVAMVSDQDFQRVSEHSWYAHRNGWYWYARSKINGHFVFMHQFITGSACQDHKNSNGLDNRRSNLRLASKSQNGANSKRSSSNTSGFKGVTRDKSRGKWQAKIGVNGQTVHLGRYINLHEAAVAYGLAAQMYFGNFARI